LAKTLGIIGLAALGLAGCYHSPEERGGSATIVGAWVVKIPDAPFPVHMFVFHSDRTVEQSNPDAGDANTSDSNLMGVWRPDHNVFKGRLVEVTADRSTHRLATRGEISFELEVSGNSFHGVASAVFFDAQGQRIRGPSQVEMEGERVLP
jgi:hypothetical protein